MRPCIFYDYQLEEKHAGFYSPDDNAVFCACCGTRFEVGEDAGLLAVTWHWQDIENQVNNFVNDKLGYPKIERGMRHDKETE